MKYFLSIGLAWLASFVFSTCEASNTQPIKLNAEFHGSLNGSSNFGDLFGYTLGVNEKFFIVGSPGASPGEQNGGAVYFFHKNVLGEWSQLQSPFFIPFLDNRLAASRITTWGDWLFVPLPGTPSNNNVKDNAGSILVFNREHNNWKLVQTIKNPQPNANDQFGAYLNYTGNNWLVVGAEYSSFAYFYKLNERGSCWELYQIVSFPDRGRIFVSISEERALITSPQSSFPSTENGSVFAYKLKNGIWTKIQTLQGTSPISNKYYTGDSFGTYTDIHHKWAIIGAPTDNVMADLAGAAYFYHYSQRKGKWVLMHKVFSEWPNVFFGSTVAIEKDIAIVGDPGKTVITDGGIRHNFQGAANVYIKHPVPWDVGKKIWSCVETLIDPEGRPYDFLGGTGLDINDYFVGVGTSPILDSFFPNGFPGKRVMPYTPPPNKGKAILYRVKHNN